MDWVVEEISAAAFTLRLMEALLPGSRSGRRKVEVSLSRIRESEGVTEAEGERSLAAPAFWKVTVRLMVSPAEMGLSTAERVTSTTG